MFQMGGTVNIKYGNFQKQRNQKMKKNSKRFRQHLN